MRWSKCFLAMAFVLVGAAVVAGTYGSALPTDVATIVYIIDCSCSMDSGWSTYTSPDGQQMSGYRIHRAISELSWGIGDLGEGTSFDVLATDRCPYATFGGLKAANEENKAQAIESISGLTGGGTTGIGPAVAWALLNPAYQEVMTYAVISGGLPRCIEDTWAYWQTNQALIRAANTKGAAIHVILIAPDYVDGSIDFDEALAGETGGTLTIGD